MYFGGLNFRPQSAHLRFRHERQTISEEYRGRFSPHLAHASGLYSSRFIFTFRFYYADRRPSPAGARVNSNETQKLTRPAIRSQSRPKQTLATCPW